GNVLAGVGKPGRLGFFVGRWAAEHMSPGERAEATVYTAGEHCPMCAAARAWVRLGDIVYVHSSEHLVAWLAEWGLEPGPVATLPIQQVAPEVAVRGPVPGLDEEMKALHRRVFTGEAR